MKRSTVKPLRFAALAPLALCAALVAGSLLPLSTLARTVTVASCARATGATTLSISAAEAGDGDKTLFAAWSSSNIVDIADASETAYVGVVAEADTEKSFTIPSEWLSNGGVVSFFLMADVPPYDALLTYIRSASAGPYIDTGFVPDTSSDVRAKTYNPANTGVVPFGVKGMLTFFSVWYSAPDPTTGAYYVSFFGASGSGTGGRGATVPRKAGPHEYKINATGAYIDGNLYQSFNSADFTESTTNSMTLFARKVDGETVGSQGDCTIYWAQLRQNGVLVHDYVPCRKNGIATLYDRVDGTLCAVKGSGSFTAGDALDPDARDCGGIESIAVVVLDDKLDIISSIDGIGSPSPEYGVTNGLAAGDSFTVSCGATPAINAAGTMQYYCTGWKLYDATNAVVSTGSETSFTYVHPDPAAYRRLEWQWEVSAYRGTIAAGYGGSVSQSGTDWFAAGTSVTVTATPNAGNGFKRWAGTLPDGVSATSASVTFTPTAPFDMTAVFETVGCSDLVFLNEKMSSHWHTATNCVIDLPIMFPDGASSATLSIAGPGYSAQYAISSGTEQYTLSLPAASSPSTENVYDLSLAFNDSASTVRTAKLGLIYGYGATTTGWTRCLAPAGTKAWSKTDGVAVIPIPYGTTSFTVALNGGEATETDTGLDGAAGWYPLRLRGSATAELAAVTPEGNLAANLSGDGAGFFLIVR